MVICTLPLLFPTSTIAQENPGLDLVKGLGCRACHLIVDRGGNAGPSLDGLSQRMTRTQLQKAIAHQRTQSSPQALPHYSHLTGRELRLLTDFLSGL